jgi:hypothetical protein
MPGLVPGIHVFGASRIKTGMDGTTLAAVAARPAMTTESAIHPALGEEVLEPVDMIVAVDDVLLAHERAEQR